MEDIEAGKELQVAIITTLKFMDDTLYKNREVFLKVFDTAFKTANLKLSAGIKKAVLTGLSERDEEADICIKNKKGDPEYDSELRDTENVPYGEDVYEYFEKEVLPYAPDAWIDENKVDHKDGKVGKVGYEIPVTRYFYKYEPPRPLEEIETDIEAVENELLTLLKKL